MTLKKTLLNANRNILLFGFKIIPFIDEMGNKVNVELARQIKELINIHAGLT